MLQCNKCSCKPVCKEVDNFKNYTDQYLQMRKISSLFDKEPECPYYIDKEQIIHNKEIEEECTCCRCDNTYDRPEDNKENKYYINAKELTNAEVNELIDTIVRNLNRL